MPRSRGQMNYEMWKLARRMNQLMDEWMHARFRGDPEGAWQPAVDIIECRQYVCVLAELAGMEPEDIDVALSGDTVTLSGVRTLMQSGEQREVRQLELARGAFRRTVHLPFEPSGDKVTISYEAGLLEIRIAKPQSET